ncbi:MAG: glycosyltransferase family 39 protein [bacterium]|nr:glycosyltransferase family 39 protein [bacterium]
MKTKLFNLALIILFSLAFLARLYKLDVPLGDWHSWRQSDTAAVTWFLTYQKFDLLHPRFFDISHVPSGQDNPQGYRFVEFPIYNTAHFLTFKLIQTSQLASRLNHPFEAAGRLTNIIFWLIGGFFLFKLIKLTANQELAFASLFFFLFLPFTIYYSRTILPGPFTVSLSLISLYLWTKFLLSPKIGYLSTAVILTALAFLTKPYALFIIAFFLAYIGFSYLKNKKILFILAAAFLISAIPLVLWRWWMSHYPQGIPYNKWLFNAGHMRFKPVWWRWLFYERIAKLILGGWGTAFILTASLAAIINQPLNKSRHYFYLVLSLIAGALAYLAIFARGNIQHDYYQIIIIPALSLILGFGLYLVWQLITVSKAPFIFKLIPTITAGVILVFSLIFSWYQIREYYKINDIQTIQTIDKIKNTIPKNAKIVTDYQGNSLLLYHFKRFGWPTITHPWPDLKQRQARFYFSPTANPTADKLSSVCQNIQRVDNSILIDLNSCHDL